MQNHGWTEENFVVLAVWSLKLIDSLNPLCRCGPLYVPAILVEAMQRQMSLFIATKEEGRSCSCINVELGVAVAYQKRQEWIGVTCGKEDGYSLTPPVDGTEMGHGKVYWCGGCQGRAEQQCTHIV